jgi:hypothetical protein
MFARYRLSSSCLAVTMINVESVSPCWRIARGLQLFREVFAVKITIWGVTSPPPQVGQATFAVARSAKVSTTSKFFLQLSHMNSYLGMNSTAVSNSPRVRSEERLDLSSLGSYPRMTRFLILARSDTKDSTSFLMAAFFRVGQPVSQEAFIARLRPRSARAAGAHATDRAQIQTLAFAHSSLDGRRDCVGKANQRR